MSTKIEWCDETINPIQDVRKGPSGRGYHCTKCSPGCDHCYAERINNIRGNGFPFEPFEDHRFIRFELIESELEKVRRSKKHKSIFVQSMGDLFHEAVPDEFIGRTYEAMANASHHTFLLLTKRLGRMIPFVWPDNVWPGLTICNQKEADKKIPVFLQVSGKKFLSIEPILGAVDLYLNSTGKRMCRNCCWGDRCDNPHHYHRPNCPICRGEGSIGKIDAVILGAETGPGARPMHPDWVRSIRDQCAAAGVPFFFKGWGAWVQSEYKSYSVFDKKSAGKFQVSTCVSSTDRKSVGQTNYYPIPFGYDGLPMGIARMERGKVAGRLLDGRTHDDLPWRVSR